MQVYGLRKTCATSKKQLKQPACEHETAFTSSKRCPIDNCSRLVKRISPHLQTFHHLDRKSALFKSMLILARRRNHSINALEFNESNSDLESSEDGNQASSATLLEVSDQSLFSESDDEVSFAFSKPGVPSVSIDVSDLGVSTPNVASTSVSNPDVSYPGLSTPDASNPDVSAACTLLPTDFLQFRSWLQSPDGGRKCMKSAKQHTFQVGTIFGAVGGNTVASLWCRQLLVRFLTVYALEKQFSPGTIKSYLSSLRHWYAYILSEEADRITVVVKQQIQHMSDRVSRWIASYRKDSAVRSLQKMDGDISKLITPEMVELFDRSELALAAIKCLGTLADGRLNNVSMTEYVAVRDFLLTQIVITNANRSGALANMTIEEFQSARKVDGSHVVSVVHHKTSYMYGPAKIVLSPLLFSWMSLFVESVRSQVNCRITGRAKFVFLSWTGEALESGQITRAVQAAWKKAGLGENITCTLMRKSAVSSFHQRYPEQKANLADLMCHTTQTASKSYRLVQRQQTAVSASVTLAKLMKTSGGASELDGDKQSVDPLEVQVHARLVWTDELLENLHSIFKHEIDMETQVVDLTTIRDKIKGTNLADIDARKIYDRLRQEKKNPLLCQGDTNATLITPQDSESLLDRVNEHRVVDVESKTFEDTISDNDSDIIAPSQKSSKTLFSHSDANTIQEVCKHIIKSGPISQSRIAKAIENAGCDANLVMKRYTQSQIISRVKYERRKLRSEVPKIFVRM